MKTSCFCHMCGLVRTVVVWLGGTRYRLECNHVVDGTDLTVRR